MTNESRDSTDWSAQLLDTGLPEEVVAMMELSPEFHENELVLKDLRGTGKFVAIENQNFPLVLNICRQVANLLLAGTFAAWAPGAIADLIFMVIDFRNQSVELTAEQGAVLLELKKSEGLTVSDLVEATGFNEGKVRGILEELKNKERGDKIAVTLVSVDEQGIWTAPNV